MIGFVDSNLKNLLILAILKFMSSFVSCSAELSIKKFYNLEARKRIRENLSHLYFQIKRKISSVWEPR